MQFMQYMNEGRTVISNWTFLCNIIKIYDWPERLTQQGKAVTTVKLYMVNLLEFLTYFRDTPSSTSRVPKKSLVAALRAVSTGLRKLSRHVLLRQLQVKKSKSKKLISKADLSACRRKAQKLIPQILEAFNQTPTQANMRRFYGYLSAYLASIYGHRTSVLTNMTLAELDKAREDAKS
ncbi:hypothetical protein CCH79_00020453, partial [Gambusia affinis]